MGDAETSREDRRCRQLRRREAGRHSGGCRYPISTQGTHGSSQQQGGVRAAAERDDHRGEPTEPLVQSVKAQRKLGVSVILWSGLRHEMQLSPIAMQTSRRGNPSLASFVRPTLGRPMRTPAWLRYC